MAGWLTFLDDPRTLMVGAALPSIGSGIWIFYRSILERRDKLREADATRDMSRDERRARELDAQTATFNSEQVRWFADLRQELRDTKTELIETRRDRDRGWDVARYWHGVAHDLLRLYRNLRHNALNMQQWLVSSAERFKVAAPVFEPIPDRPDIPMGLEDVK